MKIKISCCDIQDIHDKLYLDGVSVTKVAKKYGYSHPSAFIKALRALGYGISKAIKVID